MSLLLSLLQFHNTHFSHSIHGLTQAIILLHSILFQEISISHSKMMIVCLEEALSSLSTSPLFSSIITLYILLLLYSPPFLLGIIFSPVLFSTFILLLSLLRLGATQRAAITSLQEKPEDLNSADTNFFHEPDHDSDHKWVSCQPSGDPKTEQNSGAELPPGPIPSPFCGDSFVEWDVRAPLGVIYEAYEGEEEGHGDVLEENRETQMAVIERYASLSMYYPETDTDSSSSEMDSPENFGFRWDEEDCEGLIEISLDGKRKCEIEEDNLIEIDLSPTR